MSESNDCPACVGRVRGAHHSSDCTAVTPAIADTPDLGDPGPDDDVIVRFGDLQAIQASVDSARDDLQAIVRALSIDISLPMTAHDVVTRAVLPKINQLMVTAGLVKAAEDQLRARAGDLSLPVIDLGNGRSAVLAGRRLPAEQAKGLRRGGRRR